MGLVHWASTCEYQRFQRDVTPLLRDIRRGNYDSLQKQVVRSVTHILGRYPRAFYPMSRYVNGQWYDVFHVQSPAYFHNFGIADVADVEGIQDFTTYKIAHLLIHILDEYLTMAPSLKGNFGILTEVVRRIGWSEREATFFATGRPMPTLLSDTGETEGLEAMVDRFDLRRPLAGWFTFEEMQYFYDLLRRSETSIQRFDVYPILKSWRVVYDNPVVVRDYQEGLAESYWDAVKMTKMAVDLKEGLVFTNNIG